MSQELGHFRLLEELYETAPISRLYGARLTVRRRAAEVTFPVDGRFFHAVSALHGSAIFRALDDAAFFAANSVVPDVLVLTTSFHVDFFRPVDSGVVHATGELVNEGRRRLFARSEVRDGDGRLVAAGSGIFTKSSIDLRTLQEDAQRRGERYR